MYAAQGVAAQETDNQQGHDILHPAGRAMRIAVRVSSAPALKQVTEAHPGITPGI